MEWLHRGHEFEKLYEAWKDKDGTVLLCGINDDMTEIAERLLLAGAELFFADDIYAGESLMGKRIFSMDEAILLISDPKVITVFHKQDALTGVIKKKLMFRALRGGIDYFDAENFKTAILPVFLSAVFHKTFVDYIGHVPNFKCSLRCKNCSAAIPYLHVVNPSKAQLMEEIDLFFSKVDCLYIYDCTGGETFIVSDVLSEVLTYLFEKYGNRFSRVWMTTNATVIPTENILKVLEKYHNRIEIHISQYDGIPGWTEKKERFEELLRSRGIEYCDIFASRWIDFGFSQKALGETKEDLIKKFDICKNFCRSYINGKLIYCGHAYNNQMAFWEQENDEQEMLDLHDAGVNGTQIIEFMNGFQNKGYIGMCSHCNGWWEENNKTIPVAEQL